jgi:hypothetical protein
VFHEDVEGRAIVRVLREAAARRVFEADLRDRGDPGRPDAAKDACRELEILGQVGEQTERERLAGKQVRPEAVFLDLLARPCPHGGDFASGGGSSSRCHQVRAARLSELLWNPRAERHTGAAFADRKTARFAPQALQQPSAALERIVGVNQGVVLEE